MSVTAELQDFIVSEITPGRGIESVGVEEDLLQRGIVDSLGVRILTAFLEERYGVSVGAEDLVPANFQTVACIQALVERKRSG